jgi:type IV pilus assembly protein PilC
MTAFLATYTTRSGRRLKVSLEADSPAMARRTLRQRGILPHSLVRKEEKTTPQDSNRRGSWRDWLESGVSIREKALFANKLSTLVDAGVPILRGLDLMETQQKSPKFRRAIKGMINDVNQGDSLGNAMRRWPQVFDNLMIAMVEAGEAGGVLDDTLKRLARLLEETSRLQNQIRAAMGYPVTMLAIAILIFLGMTIFLIPTFAKVFDDLNATLPWFTLMMLQLSELLRSSFGLIILVIIMLSAFLFARYYRTPAGLR